MSGGGERGGALGDDPLSQASFGAVSLYSQHFDGIPAGGQDPARLTPHSVGLYAGMARLESLLQREVVTNGTKKVGERGAEASTPRAMEETLPSPLSFVSPDPNIRSLQVSLRACLSPPPLDIDDATALAERVETFPLATLTSGVTPLHVPTLLAFNPIVTTSFFIALGSVAPPQVLLAYLEQLLPVGRVEFKEDGTRDHTLPSSSSTPPLSSHSPTVRASALRSLEVVFSLLQRSPLLSCSYKCATTQDPASSTPLKLSLPECTHVFFSKHLSLSMCSLPPPTSPSYPRQVRLVCAYVRGVAGAGFFTGLDRLVGGKEGGGGGGGGEGSPLLMEAISFSLAHSAIGDAAQLYKYLISQVPKCSFPTKTK